MQRLGKQTFFFSLQIAFGSSFSCRLKDLCQRKGGGASGGWGGEWSRVFYKLTE